MKIIIHDSPMTRIRWYISALVALVLFCASMIQPTGWVIAWVLPSSSSTRNRSRIRPKSTSFSSSPSSSSTSPFHLLYMGGYYNEPEDAIDQSQTHMVFGLRCIETSIVASRENNNNISPVAVRGLQPVGEQEYGQLMVNHLLSQRQISISSTSTSMSAGAVTTNGAMKYEYTDTLQQRQYQQQRQTTGLVVNIGDWSRTKIVEIGSSSTGLFAYHCLGVESVLQCHTDPVRISVVEYAHLFLDNSDNNQNNNQSQSTWQTHIIENQQMIPHQILHGADWIIFTLDDMDLLQQTVQQMASIQSNDCGRGEGASKQTKILVPQKLLPESQLEYYQHNVYPDGVAMIHGLR